MSTPPDSPAALAYSTDNCQVARTMAVLGETASVLVLREVVNGVRRFDDMQRHSGVSRQVLSRRLALLVDEGVLTRVPYRAEGERERHEYRLTEKGFELFPILVALSDWGSRHLADAEGPAVTFVHRDCGGQVHAALQCDRGHDVTEPRDVVTAPGPGVRPFGG